MLSAAPLLLCNLVYADPDSGNITLLGMFVGFRASKFPTPYRRLSAYTLVIGTPGEFLELTFRCCEEQTQQIHLEEIQRIDIGKNGKRHLHIAFGEIFRFPRPGQYRFTLSHNGDVIAEHTLEVTQL